MGVNDEPAAREAPPLLRRARQAAKLGGSALRLAGRVARNLYERATSGEPQEGRPALPRRPAAPPPAGPPSVSSPSEDAPTTTPPSPEAPAGAQDEPIRTRTLARLLAQQGHRRRAMAMLESLLAETPQDAELQAELEALRATPGDGGEAEMVSLAVDEQTVWVSWRVSEQGIARARRLLGEAGPLAVRVSITAPDASTVVRTEARELSQVDASGEWTVGELPPRARATAAVGVVGQGRFVSIAHARAK